MKTHNLAKIVGILLLLGGLASAGAAQSEIRFPLKNGEKADATQVMTNFEQVLGVGKTAQTTADEAKATAAGAKTAADTAKTTADAAKTTADTAKTTADTAKTTADGAKATADNLKLAVDPLLGVFTVQSNKDVDAIGSLFVANKTPGDPLVKMRLDGHNNYMHIWSQALTGPPTLGGGIKLRTGFPGNTNDVTITPEGELYVDNNVRTRDNLFVRNDAPGDPLVEMRIDGHNNYMHIWSQAPSSAPPTLGGGIKLRTGFPGNTSDVTITPEGAVGIGIGPSTTLDVNGGMRMRMGPGGNGLFFGLPTDNQDPIYFMRHPSDSPNNSTLFLVLGDDPGPANIDKLIIGTEKAGLPEPRFEFTSDGRAWKASAGGTWENPSDARLKRDIRPLENALDSLLALRGRTFYYKDPSKLGGPGLCRGFIAQEVEPVFPEWVNEHKGYKTVGISGFEALTVESLRELNGRNDSLRKDVGELRAENEALKQRVASLEAMQQELASLRAAFAAFAPVK